ncbi:hypothetical protein PGT21_030016 [Puccinia graminis f. sp. tritici]|uniref:Uncharacterized protein n=2 Tax=Puccinia graminis f. sp. tritici TaxID=56615 RepID=E3K436_PUCGT|nr:uncharacterized protein PGTG_04794 [Puccinia graminis f. sp. tritici CRL 75-36-700-3]KAA1069718.1 hypothetical protein PGT21_032056 [Puccinia graminis f. sp. tritici]EFP78838.2 hypothetical protein PGTG_04794 [Puccinia graminis f. sp. tritici CRL 75-36-700-3]KAA1086066.1 hypothetical protein PGTUg99_013591 [Puccinia graminis f. sp. tritici]KAA1104701.1 hypothetical protein PGT21_030016 [Puccinia graminis f. sp. tritici]KAA1133360.1 hypothetical protein PGTUg99_027611 [Puccinia graminis f. s
MSDEQDEGSYIEEDEEEEEEEEDQFTSSEFQQDERGGSMSYLRFHAPAGAGEGLDSEPGEGEAREEGTEMEELDEEELDSLAEASEDQVVRRALEILGLDPDGRVLPLSADQELLLHSLWAKSGAADLRPGLAPASAKPLDSHSALAPKWLRDLRHSVLFSPPSDPQEEENLVNAIKKNLCSIVNNLSEDQWRHPPPPSFLPSTSCSSSRANPEGFEGATSSTHEHEAYLQREFNPLSLVSSLAADSMADSAQPPRQLWLGEDEDDGLDSEASLIDLLNASPALPESANQSHLSPTWPRPRRSNTRHAQSSSLARQVSRLGMGE